MAETRVSRYGLTLVSEAAWDARIYRRPAAAGEQTMPIAHLSTRPLPAERGDYGSGVVEQLGPDDVFVALLEFGPELAGSGLFARHGRPRLAPSQFGPDRMPRPLPGRSAAQHFFSEGGRAFCLYVVLGSHARRMSLVPKAAGLVARITVTGRTASGSSGGTS